MEIAEETNRFSGTRLCLPLLPPTSQVALGIFPPWGAGL